jgi:integrase-like protein
MTNRELAGQLCRPGSGTPGRVYRRCGCRDSASGRQVWRCPRLIDPDHGRWYFAVQVTGLDGRRTRVRKGGFVSRAAAERAGWELLRVPGPRAVARMWTVRRWLQFWLSEVDGRLRPTTVVNYRSIVDGYLIEHLGGYRLSKLRTVDVQRAFDRMSRHQVRGGRLVSPASLHRIRAVLRSALSEAQRQGMIGYNPAWRIRLPTGARALPVVWTGERVRAWEESGIRPRVAVWDLPHLARFLEAVRSDALFPLLWLARCVGCVAGNLPDCTGRTSTWRAGCCGSARRCTTWVDASGWGRRSRRRAYVSWNWTSSPCSC